MRTMTMTRTLTFCLLGAIAIYLGVHWIGFGIAHGATAADPVATATAAADGGIGLITTYGLMPGAAMLLYGIVSALLRVNESTHWITKGRTLAIVMAAMSIVGAVLAWRFNGAPSGSIVAAAVAAIGLVMHPTTAPAAAPRDPQAGRSNVAALIALLAMLTPVAVAVVALACISARQRGAAGVVAFLDCEAANLPPDTLADATALGIGAIGNAISGSGHVDASKIKADMSSLKTDLGRCAFAAAIAVLTTPAPVQPGAPAAAELVVDAAGLKVAFDVARAQLGWPSVRVAGGQAP